MMIRPTQQLLSAICRYRSGDAATFDTIYNESIQYITKCVLNVLNRTAPDASDDLQQDIIQDTYLTIASNLHALVNPEAFLQWAGQIATHHAQRTWTKNVRQQQTEVSDDEALFELADDRFIPEDILESKEKQLLIRKMLDELPLNQYLCVVEYFYNGLKEAEVAQKLGMPLNTVKTNLSRAKKKLRTAVETTEKKSGIRLYSLGGMLLFLFQAEMLELYVDPRIQQNTLEGIRLAMYPAAAEIASGVSSSASASASASASTAASAGTSAAASAGTSAAASAGAGIFSSLAVKIAAGVAAAALMVGVAVAVKSPSGVKTPGGSSDFENPSITAVPTEATEATEETEPVILPTGTLSFRPEADVGDFPLPYTVTLTNTDTQEVHTLEVDHHDTVTVTVAMGIYDLTLESEIGTLHRSDIRIHADINTTLQSLVLQVPPIFLSPEELAYLEKVTSEALLGAVPDGYVPYTNPYYCNPDFDGSVIGIPYAMEHVLIGCAGPGGLLPGESDGGRAVIVSETDAREFLINVFGYAPQWDNWYNNITVAGDGTIRIPIANGSNAPKYGLFNVEYLDYRTIRVTSACKDISVINYTILQRDSSSAYGWRIMEIRAKDGKISTLSDMHTNLRQNGVYAVSAGESMLISPGSLTEEGTLAVARAHWFREMGFVPENITLLAVCLHGNSNAMYVFCCYDGDGTELDRIAVNEWDGLIYAPCDAIYTFF